MVRGKVAGMKRYRKKLLICLGVILILAGLTGFDYVRSRMFTIELDSLEPETAVADGQTPVTITLLVRDHRGEAVEGHILFAVAKNGGMFYSQREETGPDGRVTFVYYPYKANSLSELVDARVEFLDESNSVFIEIAARMELSIALKEPEENKVDSSLLDGIFGE